MVETVHTTALKKPRDPEHSSHVQGNIQMAVQYNHGILTTDIGRRRAGTSSRKSLMKSGGARTNPELAVDHHRSFGQDLSYLSSCRHTNLPAKGV